MKKLGFLCNDNYLFAVPPLANVADSENYWIVRSFWPSAG